MSLDESQKHSSISYLNASTLSYINHIFERWELHFSLTNNFISQEQYETVDLSRHADYAILYALTPFDCTLNLTPDMPINAFQAQKITHFFSRNASTKTFPSSVRTFLSFMREPACSSQFISLLADNEDVALYFAVRKRGLSAYTFKHDSLGLEQHRAQIALSASVYSSFPSRENFLTTIQYTSDRTLPITVNRCLSAGFRKSIPQTGESVLLREVLFSYLQQQFNDIQAITTDDSLYRTPKHQAFLEEL